MGKTRAQYQKEYRERKKQRDETFLQTERERTRKYKVGIGSLGKKEKEDLRAKNRRWKQQSRERQKTCKEQENGKEPEVSAGKESNTDERSTRSNNNTPLTLTLNFNKSIKKSKKRSKALRTAATEIKRLKDKVAMLSKANAKYRKRNQRLTGKSINRENQGCSSKSSEEKTPNSKANAEIRSLGLTPRKVPRSVRKKLVMANAVVAEIQMSCKRNKKQKKRKIVANVVSGKIVKKYKCLNALAKETGISRASLGSTTSKSTLSVKRRRNVIARENLKRKVIHFMERDDVSVNMPGKNDFKKTTQGGKEEKRQVRILTDYLQNLYEKFRSENPDVYLSKATFCRMRPKHILLTKLITRNTCLCSKHQNFAMKLKCLRSYGIDVSQNPETVYKTIDQEKMKEIINDGLQNKTHAEFEQWKRVDIGGGKKKMKIVKISMPREDFKQHMDLQYQDFQQHVSRVKMQYAAIKVLKEELPPNEILVHMDFAENFSCSNVDEIQSAYWNSIAVTLHPAVVYYKADQLEHKNFIFVSDVLNHNATAVNAIIKKLMPELKALMPEIKMIHYWTDSPSSQYRNRYIIDLVQHHRDIHGAAARWNYFEAGHGKGPCDGLGGVAKRQAAEACKQGKGNIQDANDFYERACAQTKSIKYIFYSNDDYEESSRELDNRNPKAIKGTMKLHAVFPVADTLYTREVSCYCNTCLKGEPCTDWIKEQPVSVSASSSACGTKRKAQEALDPTDTDEKRNKFGAAEVSAGDEKEESIAGETSIAVTPGPGMFALVNWEDAIYPARITNVDADKHVAEVSFMEETQGRKGACILFKWPEKNDI